jgi:hypothetical protein
MTAKDDTVDKINWARHAVGRIYLGGIPSLLNDDGAFLSFICVVSATEALAGFCHPTLGNGDRFKKFVEAYFPEQYKPLSSKLWDFRNALVHAFNPGPFVISHHQSELHFTTKDGQIVINAEEFYAALVTATQEYFKALNASEEMQRSFLTRLADKKGGLPIW